MGGNLVAKVTTLCHAEPVICMPLGPTYSVGPDGKLLLPSVPSTF